MKLRVIVIDGSMAAYGSMASIETWKSKIGIAIDRESQVKQMSVS